MYAITVEQLQKLIKEHPETSPSAFLRDDGLAARCYDDMSVRELKAAFNRDPDLEACELYQLTPGEWREEIEMALVARQTVERRRKGAVR